MTQETEGRPETDQASGQSSVSDRRPYTPPQLRLLGSVRTLTLGTGGAIPDGSIGRGKRGRG